MPEIKILPTAQVVRTVGSSERLVFALLLGAGASKSSGVLLASEMIAEWRKMAHAELSPEGVDFETWCQQQDWYQKEDEYSLLFELLYVDAPLRQKYVEKRIKDAFPSWGYLYLASIIGRGRFNVIFTTNFDDLINDALTIFLGYNPVVCAADSQVSSIRITSERAKIIKLHGDYLFERLKNTPEELQELDPNMERKLKQFCAECGLVVIGYAGRDESVMRVIEELLMNPLTFPDGIYWGVRSSNEIPPRVSELARAYPKRIHLFDCADFDVFMARLHKELKYTLPETIIQPYQTLKTRYQRLLTCAVGNDAIIKAHIEKLEGELKRPWATAKPEDFDLLQAQLALGRRDYKSAMAVITAFLVEHPDSSEGFATWGDALALQAEEEGSEAVWEDAVAKWKQAIRLGPTALPPRYSLSRHYTQKQNLTEGISVCEELRRLVPNDMNLRRNLVQFYGSASRYDDAQREIEWLLQREPGNADFHMMQATLFEQKGLVPEAIESMRRAVSLGPRNPWIHLTLANSLANTARTDEAATELERAIELDPHNLNFRIRAAMLYNMLQQSERALSHLQAAVASGPHSAEVRGWLCQTLMALGQFPAAQTEGEEAARLSPRDSRIRITVGMAYLQNGQPQFAEPHFQAAMQINSNAPDAYVALCWLYHSQNRVIELNYTLRQLALIAPQIAQMLQIQFQSPQNNWQGQPANWGSAPQNQWPAPSDNAPANAWTSPAPAWGPPPLPGASPPNPATSQNIWDNWRKILGGG